MKTDSKFKKSFSKITQKLRSNPKKYLSLLGLFIFVLITLVVINKEYGEIKDSEAAVGSDISFSVVSSKSLNKQQKSSFDQIAEDKTNAAAQLIRIQDKSKIANANTITIPLFEQQTITLNRSYKNTINKTVKVWVSEKSQNGIKYPSIIIINGQTIIGKIFTPEVSYSLNSLVNNDFVLMKKNEKVADMGDNIITPIAGNTTENLNLQSPNSSQGNPKIRVLFPYTTSARDYKGGQANIESWIYYNVELSNWIYRESGINASIEFAGFMTLGGGEVTDGGTNLARLKDNYDNLYDEVHAERNRVGADLVHAIMYHPNLNVCGVAFYSINELHGFGMTSSKCLDSMTVTHEIGHNLMAAHDKRVSTNPYYTYGHGLVLMQHKSRTVMAYNDPACPGGYCNRIPYMTNPDKQYNGSPLGTNSQENNVKVINTTASYVAGFRSGGGTGGGGGSSCPILGTKTCGQTCLTSCDCDPNGNYVCEDKSNDTPGKECWNESMCIIAPPRNRRISGKVLDCNGNPKANVKVATKGYSFDKSATTNSQGIFQIWETNNECNVEKDKGQTFAVLAGKDADNSQTEYYGRVNSPVFSKPEINCGNINCNYIGNQATGGPARQNYRLSVGDCTNASTADDTYFCKNPNVYNSYVCEEDPNFLSGFDFKQVGCPTPTPTPLACNSVCTSDAQCASANGSWYCARQFNYGTWSDVSLNVDDIQYTIGNGTTVYTDTAAVTGFNTHVYGTRVEQHLVKGGKVFYRDFDGTAWDQYWTDVTSNIPSNLAGTTIIDFNSYRKPNGKIEQHLIKTSAPNNIVYSQNNENGWANATWVPVTDNLTGNGTGPITGFTAYVDQDGYMIYNMVRNGQLWEGSNINGSNPNWKVQTGLSGCAGTSAGKCGSATLLSVERSKNTAGKDELYLIRGGGKMYYRESTPTDERCRHRTYPFSASCSN